MNDYSNSTANLEENAIRNYKRFDNVWIFPKRDSRDRIIFDKTYNDYFKAFQQSHSPFLAKIKTEEEIQLPDNLKLQVQNISTELNLEDGIQADIEKLLLKIYVSNSKEKINISKSGDREFLIYMFSEGTSKNVLIDEDGDIELLIIPSNKSKTHNKKFYKQDGLNFSKVVSTFNEMR